MKVCFESGEEARATSLDGNTLTLRSPKAFAPGSPIRFSITANDDSRTLEGRTIGSKRIDQEHFEVRLRFVNLRRTDRELLERELA